MLMYPVFLICYQARDTGLSTGPSTVLRNFGQYVTTLVYLKGDELYSTSYHGNTKKHITMHLHTSDKKKTKKETNSVINQRI